MRQGAQDALSGDKVKGAACAHTPPFPPGTIKPHDQECQRLY